MRLNGVKQIGDRPSCKKKIGCNRVREKIASHPPGQERPALVFAVSFFPSLRQYSRYSVERAKMEASICKPSPGLRSREFQGLVNAKYILFMKKTSCIPRDWRYIAFRDP
jgi:hypothetical protein